MSPANKILPPATEEFSRSIAAAAKSFEAAKESKKAARLARLAGRKAAPTPEEAKAAQEERKAEIDRVRSLTKALISLAGIGSLDGMQKAIAQGANLSKAVERGNNPAMAAIHAGHSDLALWIMAQPGHRWADEARGSAHYTELSAALSVDNAELFERIIALRPGIMAKSKAHSHYYYGEVSLMDAALTSAPKVAGWLIENEPKAAAAAAALATKREEEAQRHRWTDHAGALSIAIERQMAQAGPIFELLRSTLERPESVAASALLARFVRQDDAASLAWLFTKSPIIALGCGRGTTTRDASGFSTYWMESGTNGIKAPDLAARVMRAGGGSAGEKARSKALRIPTALWAAGHRAQDCVDFLLDIPMFREQVAQCQEKPEQWLWEAAYLQVGEPGIVASLSKAGMDFTKIAPGDWSYPALFMRAQWPTVKWLEMVGKEMSGLLGPRALDGLTPFDICSKTHGEEPGSKALAMVEKIAMKGSAGAKRGGNAAKATAAARRRL